MFTRATVFLAVAICCGNSITSLQAADEAEKGSTPQRIFRAGAAISDITPPLGERRVGDGSDIVTAIHDRLHARCLILDDGQDRIGFVVCDNVGIPRDVYDDARRIMADETTIDPSNLLMAATHTHSATRASSEKYRPRLVRGIADAVRDAVSNLEAARIGWGSVAEPSEVFNRRWFVTDPELLKNPFGGVDRVRSNPPRGSTALLRPAGPVDPEISFISVQSIEGRPIALLANYSLHYVAGTNRQDVSADYFGVFSNRIGELLDAESVDPPFVGMLSNGTSGDVNNINKRLRKGSTQKYEKIAQVAELVAQRVNAAHSEIEFYDWVPVGAAWRDLTLRYRKPDEQMRRHFAKVKGLPEDSPRYHPSHETYAARVQRLWEGPDEVVSPVQVLRIGELGIAAIGFEVFAETGIQIKQKSPFADTFTIELANDARGYLPTPAQHELGGYETWMGTNRVQLDASVLITKTLLEMMEEMR